MSKRRAEQEGESKESEEEEAAGHERKWLS
jgi:hypothetical protein